MILKLCEDASSLKINFLKTKFYGLEHIKIELINQEKWNGHNFPLKYLKLFLVTLSPSEGIIKNISFPPRHLAQLSIWRWALVILDTETQLNSPKIKWILRLLNPTNALWKDLMLYRLKLILNSNQGLVFFRQKQILRSI